MNCGTTELQKLADKAINDYQLPGLQLGILNPGKDAVLVSSGTFDFRHRKTAIDNHQSFRVGSTTKMFVAALICRYAEQGRLKLTDPLSKWYPEYPSADTISVKDLLNQTSGIGESLFTNPGILVSSMLDHRKMWNPTEVMDKLSRSTHPEKPENRKFVYSNNNYVLLGLIAEKTGEGKLSDLLTSEFFIPLGMKDTALLPFQSAQISVVPGYDEYIPLGPHLISADQSSWDSLTFAAGALASSAGDLLIWLNAFFHGEVVSQQMLRLMRTYVNGKDNGRDDSIEGYGLGLALYVVNGFKLEGHPGGGFGGECFPFWDSSTDTAYVVCYNLSRKNNPAGKQLLLKMIESVQSQSDAD